MNEIQKSNDRFKIVSFVALILRKDGHILLIRRFNTGDGDGLYALAGGGIDGNEPATQAIVREAHEELGITLKKEHLKVVHVLHSKTNYEEAVGFFIEATAWQGEPQNMEPHKHDDVRWFASDKLPHNTFPALKNILKLIDKNIFFSEHGWY